MPSITVEPCTFALFGALGDLALRKLFPALYQLDRADLLHGHAHGRVLFLAQGDFHRIIHAHHLRGGNKGHALMLEAGQLLGLADQQQMRIGV